MRLLLLAIRSGVILKTICYQRSCGLKFSEYRTSTCRVFAVARSVIVVAMWPSDPRPAELTEMSPVTV
eukprot:s1222_g9.t1